MVQDTAWEGYEEIPTWIIQGYSTSITQKKRLINLLKCVRKEMTF